MNEPKMQITSYDIFFLTIVKVTHNYQMISYQFHKSGNSLCRKPHGSMSQRHGNPLLQTIWGSGRLEHLVDLDL